MPCPYFASAFRVSRAAALEKSLGYCSGGHPLSIKCHLCATRSSYKCHAERSEASRSSIKRFLSAMNEILRRSASQNDIGQEPIISREPRSGDREIPVMLLTKIPLWNKPHTDAAKPAHQCHAERSEPSRSSTLRVLLRGTRFFVAVLLRMTMTRTRSFRASHAASRE